MKKSRTMEELHEIREDMYNMSEEEKAELLNSVRQKYKEIIHEKKIAS